MILQRIPAYVAALGHCNEEAVLCAVSSSFSNFPISTYTSGDSGIVLVAIVHIRWFFIGSRGEHAAEVVYSGRDELLAIRCV
jgi:hypothetical protein